MIAEKSTAVGSYVDEKVHRMGDFRFVAGGRRPLSAADAEAFTDRRRGRKDRDVGDPDRCHRHGPDGRIVPDLRPEEVEIYENGEKQTVTGFSFVSKSKTAPKEKKRNRKRLAIPEPPLVLRPEQVRRTIALVVDDLTLSFESGTHASGSCKKFVDEQMQDGDLVGIIRTGTGIGALQQFTSNKSSSSMPRSNGCNGIPRAADVSGRSVRRSRR